MNGLDNWVASCLALLAVWIVVSGLDDLALDLVCVFEWVRARVGSGDRRPWPSREQLAGAPEKRVAVFVPLWREDRVIGKMLEHNLAAINYGNYEVFLGAYPNDRPTLEAAAEARRRFPRVRLVVCPHDGPTSKADCLNWIFQGMLLEEEQWGIRYDLVVLHDAEDVVHPESLRWMNWLADRYDMVQIPVLPLATPLGKLTHGVYCDEFAEFQSKDLPARQVLGGFLPCCGVGVGYTRRALERLAGEASNCLFDPGCLTEDYDVGLRLHRLGCPQVCLPVRFLNGRPLATRELFPDCIHSALRQRTRWVIGIALQCWQKHGWREGYWFWRDRKGLVGNPLSLLVNLLTLYGVVTWLETGIRGAPWGLAEAVADLSMGWLFQATLLLLLWRTGVRALCVGRVYGWRFALGVPLRMIWAVWVNGLATLSALGQYLEASLERRPLVWVKTEHRYPSRTALVRHKRLLGEILVGSGYLEEEQLEKALSSQPTGRLLGDHLVRLGLLSQEMVYEALSLQQNLPFERLEPAHIQRPAWRALAPALARRWRVVPFRLERGQLFVASPDLPTEEGERELRAACGLELRFHLITPANLEELRRQRRQASPSSPGRGSVPVQ